jgi:hypothetical protein
LGGGHGAKKHVCGGQDAMSVGKCLGQSVPRGGLNHETHEIHENDVTVWAARRGTTQRAFVCFVCFVV